MDSLASVERCAQGHYLDRGPALPIGDKARCAWCSSACWNRGCSACSLNFHKTCYYVHLAQAKAQVERARPTLNRPPCVPPKVLQERELRPLLREIGVEEYLPGLAAAGINGHADLVETDEGLLKRAGVAKVLHRRKLLKHIAVLAASMHGVAGEDEPCVLLELKVQRQSPSEKLGLVLKEENGVLVVQEVLAGAVAASSGFEAGMVVYKINGQMVGRKEEFMAAISKHPGFHATVRPREAEVPPALFERLFPKAREGRAGRDDYERISLLGCGASSKVFLVRHKKTHQLYALKTLDKRAILSGGTAERPTWRRDLIMRERDMMRTVQWQHDGLVRLHHTFQSPTQLYFVLDYCPGGDLYNYLGAMPEGCIPEDLARYYAAQVFLALRSLHKAGVVYRDLKPENILLDERGNAKLADFGLSRPLAWGDRANTFVGTPEYMAPEMIDGKPYSYAVDWWAFGVVIYNMLTGEHAFGGGSSLAKDIWHDVLTSTPVILPQYGVTAGAKSLLDGLLEKDHELRLEGDVIGRQPWFRGMDWPSIEARTSSPPRWTAPKSMVTPTKALDLQTFSFHSDSNGDPLSTSQQAMFKDFSLTVQADPMVKN